MSNTAASSPRGSNSPSPYPEDRKMLSEASASGADGSSSFSMSRRAVNDADMEDRSDSPAGFASSSRISAPHPPPSPSSTSQSDDGGAQDFADLPSVEDPESGNGKGPGSRTGELGFDPSQVRLSRRGTLIPASPTSSNGTWILQDAPLNSASNLPHEILLHIFKYVVLFPPDLLSCLQVCKSWCLNGVELLWHRPTFYKISSLFKLAAVIRKPDQLFPYANFVRRLNFTVLANQLEDQLFLMMAACTRLERLTLAGCSNISDATLVKVFQHTKQLVALDLTDLEDLSDASLFTLAANCPRIQGINLSGCKKITSEGVVALAKCCRQLRRAKLCGCHNIDDEALIALTQFCPALLEVDLIQCPKISDHSVREIWTRCYQMRELRLAHCGELTDNAFPSARGTTGVPMLGTTPSTATRSAIGTSAFMSDSAPTSRGNSPGPNFALGSNRGGDSLSRTMTAPIAPLPTEILQHRLFDHLRILDLTSCSSISDDSVEGIVANVPRLKNLALTKCTRLTDESLYSIAKLGKNLHYLHLGHVSNITDRAVTHLARSCTRLRYIDVACCPNLTDLSVTEIANNMPKLRRIGLVKVINLTDQAIYGLVDRYRSLERIHLSYCENVSIPAIFWVLQNLPRLTHLSLTGIPAFRRPELQAMCRPAPKDFNEHQRQAFCVYSGKGVSDLRKFLQRVYSDEQSASEFGLLEPRVRESLANLTTENTLRHHQNTHRHHPQGDLHGLNRNVHLEAPALGAAAPTAAAHHQSHYHPNVGTRRVVLTPAEQMYYEQQRQLARIANARRAAEDTRRLMPSDANANTATEALARAQEQRNPGLPLIGRQEIGQRGNLLDDTTSSAHRLPLDDGGSSISRETDLHTRQLYERALHAATQELGSSEVSPELIHHLMLSGTRFPNSAASTSSSSLHAGGGRTVVRPMGRGRERPRSSNNGAQPMAEDPDDDEILRDHDENPYGDHAAHAEDLEEEVDDPIELEESFVTPDGSQDLNNSVANVQPRSSTTSSALPPPTSASRMTGGPTTESGDVDHERLRSLRTGRFT